MNKNTRRIFLINGIIALLFGMLLLIVPAKEMLSILGSVGQVLFGTWAVILGLLQIILAPRLRKKVRHHLLLTINGIITLAFGLLLFYYPLELGKAVTLATGAMAVIAGMMMVLRGFFTQPPV